MLTDPDATPAQPSEHAAAAPPPAAGVHAGRLSLEAIWLILPLAMAFIFVTNTQIHPADFWWHVRTGQIITETGQIPTTDRFTFTRAGEPWTNQGWLMQVFLYLEFQAGGLPLVIFIHALTIAAGYLLIEQACLYVPGVRPRDAALATVGAMAIGVVNWGVRPQSASYVCFGALIYILARHRARGGKIIWALPPLFAAWINLHGGFIFGLGLLAITCAMRIAEEWAAARRIDPRNGRLLAASAASLLALSLNPGGPVGAVRYVIGFLASNTTLNKNIEFQALSIREADGAIFFAIMIAFLLLLWRRRAPLPAGQTTLLIVFGLASLYARRIAPWFGMAAAPAFAAALAGRPASLARPPRPQKARLNALVFGLIALLVISRVPWLRPILPATFQKPYEVTEYTPIQATEVLCRMTPPTPLRTFANIYYASYLAWACPTVPTFMDTRFELYPTAMWQDYIRIINGQFGWEERLAHYAADTLFVQKESEKELIAAARASGRWKTTYEDQFAIIMQRTGGPAAP
jgi:hypothetical protein